LKEGRVVVTNIRGLTSLDRILDQFPEYQFPETADLIHINTEIAEGRKVMAGWFHWVPFGALILMDEGQRIYPDRRDFKLESLDKHVHPDGYHINDIHVTITDDYTGETYAIGRPEDIFTAFDMQRHYQWDIFISTTHINKIQKPIKEASQTAYLHKSLSGKLPFLFKDTWYEFQHDPETTGKLPAHRIGKPRKYKADTRIYKCYQSTVTGEHTESKADQSVLGDSGVRFKLFAIFLSIGIGIYMLIRFSAAHEAVDLSARKAPLPDTEKSAVPDPGPAKNDTPTLAQHDPVYVPVQQTDTFTGHLGYSLLMVSHNNFLDKTNKKLSFIVDTVDGIKDVSYQELERHGYKIHARDLCSLIVFAADGQTKAIGCDSPRIYGCDAAIKTKNIIIQHHCKKYGQTEIQQPKPTNALVAAAASPFSSGSHNVVK